MHRLRVSVNNYITFIPHYKNVIFALILMVKILMIFSYNIHGAVVEPADIGGPFNVCWKENNSFGQRDRICITVIKRAPQRVLRALEPERRKMYRSILGRKLKLPFLSAFLFSRQKDSFCLINAYILVRGIREFQYRCTAQRYYIITFVVTQ